MKNKKEIWLNPEELKQLLEGGLYWKDIESKIYDGEAGSFNRNLKKEDLKIEHINWEQVETSRQQEQIEQQEQKNENEDELARSILLGEERSQDTPADQGSQNSVLKDRQINFAYFQEELTDIPHAAVGDEEETKLFGSENFPERENGDLDVIAGTSYQEDSDLLKDNMNDESPANTDNSFIAEEEFLFSRDMESKEGSSIFSGLKLVLLLVITAALTFCLWFYFIGR